MFAFRGSFKSQPDTYRLELGFSHDDALTPRTRPGDQDGSRYVTPTVEWQSSEADEAVLIKVKAALADPSLVEERVHLELLPFDAVGVVAARLFDGQSVAVHFSFESRSLMLRSVHLSRTAGAGGGLRVPLALGIWALLDAASVTRLRCNDSAVLPWDAGLLGRLQSLHVLNLSHCGLTTLPGAVGSLTNLQELRLVGNKLKVLPPELGQLRRLRTLAADSNEISILPGELRNCRMLEELTLENNRLTSVLLSFNAFPQLQVLHLYNNPLEFLPEFSPCLELRHLSVANLRVTATAGYSKFKVELLQAPSGSSLSLFDTKQADRLRPIFSLMLRRSSGHHPLLAGALRCLAEEDPKNRDLMASQENSLQQLILMALNDNSIVVEQTCATLILLARHSKSLADCLVSNDIMSIISLLNVHEEPVQLSCLQVLASIALASMEAGEKLLTPRLLTLLMGLLSAESSSPELQSATLEALGNLAFAAENKARYLRQPELMDTVLALAKVPSAAASPSLRRQGAAVRLLAILGENEHVLQAVGRQPIGPRGLRVLAMDGGGMKGISTVRMLRELEERTGRQIHELFDLIVGTSTGGLLAVAVGLRKLSLDECDHIYKVLGQKVFSKPLASKDKEETWMESFYRTFHSRTQHVRAVVVGCKHDAAVYEGLLKDYCDFSKEFDGIGDSMIDTACLDAPKVALVATLASVTPASPFVFRNYELSPDKEVLSKEIYAAAGSSKHAVWQAVRASSAATYYLDDFTCGNDKFQDGAVTANNPAVIALQEARLLWPERPIEVFVSIGSGSTPVIRRDKALSSFMETGSILIESATSVQRAAETMATLLPLVPRLQYFRFTPVDPRCAMELDEVDPAAWDRLEAATDDYVASAATLFAAAAAALGASQQQGNTDARATEELQPQHVAIICASSTWATAGLDRVAEACGRRTECVGIIDLASSNRPRSSEVHYPATATGPDLAEAGGHLAELGSSDAPQPEDSSPGVPGFFRWFGSDPGARHTVSQAGDLHSQPYFAVASSSRAYSARSTTAEAASECHEEKSDLLQSVRQLGRIPRSANILHLALPVDTDGFVLKWEQDLQGVLEPSECALCLWSQDSLKLPAF